MHAVQIQRIRQPPLLHDRKIVLQVVRHEPLQAAEIRGVWPPRQFLIQREPGRRPRNEGVEGPRAAELPGEESRADVAGLG